MTKDEEKEIIDRVRKETLDFSEEQRKNAFPFPPQSIDDYSKRKAEEAEKKPSK